MTESNNLMAAPQLDENHQLLMTHSRYYNGDFPNYAPDHVDFLKNFFLAQIDSYETGPSGIGWFMWTMKVVF